MSSQLSSSTTTTKKRKLLASDADEVFVLKKKKEVTVSKTVSISIPDLLEKINDDNTNCQLRAPLSKLGKRPFVLLSTPNLNLILPGTIGIGISNWNKEDVILSWEWKKTPHPFSPLPFSKVAAKAQRQRRCAFMSHDEYKQWTMIHGDVFILIVTLTLHLQESSSQSTMTNLRSKSLAVSEPPGSVEKMCLEEGVFSDFTILSEEDRRFPCHRIILAAKSSTLKAMLTIEMKENEENELKLRYNNQVVEAFVSYFYKGEVPTEVLEANLPSFLKLLDFYDLQPMKAQVENTAINGLTLENVVEMFSLANLHNAGALKEATSFFILENKKDLGQQDLSQVPASVMTELFKLLSQS